MLSQNGSRFPAVVPSRRAVLAALAILPLATSCAVPGFREPLRLYNLTSAKNFPDSLPRVDQQLLVEMPVAASGLDTARVALRTSPTSINYFARANWTDRAPAMMQSLIVESLENSGRIVSVGRDTVGLRADWLLKSDLREFQAEYGGEPGETAPVVRVRLNAKLVSMPQRTIEASETFEALTTARGPSLDDVVTAYDAAAEQVLRRLVAWVLTEMPTASR